MTRKDLQIQDPSISIGYPLIVEGQLYETVLDEFSLDQQWLVQELQKKGIQKLEDVFFASINRSKQLMITEKQQKIQTPQLFH
ncbi:YetF domain-containing protein [Bacillus sp. AK128]